MENEKIDELKNNLYRYRTLYEIELEENKLLKEQLQNIYQQQAQQAQQQAQEQPKRSIIYRGLRKIYRTVKR